MADGNEAQKADILISPETGHRVTFAIRPLTLAFGGHSQTIDMPGWYGEGDDDAVFGDAGQATYHRAMTTLKARAGGLPEPMDTPCD